MSTVDQLLASLPNLRDLGGLRTTDGRRTRRGVLFRSESPCLATPDDLAALHTRLRIAEVVDLRRADEHDAAPLPPALARHARWHRVPFDIAAPPHVPSSAPDAAGLTATEMGRFYAWMVQRNAPRLREVCTLLADARAPALIHCAIGKDRTGVTVALVLLALGVDHTAVVDDYARSDPCMRAVLRRVDDRVTEDRLESDMRLRAPASSMLACLDALAAAHGSVAAFLSELDPDGSIRGRLRARLLESADAP